MAGAVSFSPILAPRRAGRGHLAMKKPAVLRDGSSQVRNVVGWPRKQSPAEPDPAGPSAKSVPAGRCFDVPARKKIGLAREDCGGSGPEREVPRSPARRRPIAETFPAGH